jgi:DNA-binding CsgD family transcriptional regulator
MSVRGETAASVPATARDDRRDATQILIVDRDLRTIAHALPLDDRHVSRRIRALLERHVAERTGATHATVGSLDAETSVRIVDVAGERGDRFAIMFERFAERRDAVEAVAAEHRLTNREREVFRMLLAGATDVEISQHLVIARTTASDHAKHILRKTGTTRRTELFAKVITYEGRAS